MVYICHVAPGATPVLFMLLIRIVRNDVYVTLNLQ